ncbi:MAG: hypothetical protein IJB04_08490 [Oscillospiraceae bacterium]|nr:hypothetical protein [Oscillospiraceae bacterium]
MEKAWHEKNMCTISTKMKKTEKERLDKILRRRRQSVYGLLRDYLRSYMDAADRNDGLR